MRMILRKSIKLGEAKMPVSAIRWQEVDRWFAFLETNVRPKGGVEEI